MRTYLENVKISLSVKHKETSSKKQQPVIEIKKESMSSLSFHFFSVKTALLHRPS